MTLEQHCTDHLLLLVGTNPLPNLIAAKSLLKPGGKLHLVYSEETTKVADRLARHFQKSTPGFEIAPILKVKATKAHDIEDQIGICLQKLTGTVGLHYTGGTKAMAVHAYRAVERFAATKGSQPVFSYLDKDTFEMRIDPDWHESVLLDVTPSLEDLASLHGATFQHPPKRADQLVMVDVANALAQSAANGGLETWRAWCGQELRKKARNERGWLSKTNLFDVAVPLPQDSVLADVVVLLREALRIPEKVGHLPLHPDKLGAWPFKKRDPKYLCGWLDGEWLEHYILHQVLMLGERCHIHDAAMDLQTDQAKSDFNFQLDVAAMRGYQLFAFSCTTDTTSHLAKLKLFEAVIRARQLGGDEARVGLVCGYERAHNFAGQIVQDWFTKDTVKVLGPDDLPDLGDHLAHWFETAK